MKDLLKIRKEYMLAALDESHTRDIPMEQFKEWLNEAIDSGVLEPNAMMLSTVNNEGQPSARIVLVREVLKEGIGFYTNYGSRKAMELEDQPKAALTFFWPELERQVRFEGSVSKLSREVSERYFAQRPRGSQIGAWTSPQSCIIASRDSLVASEEKLKKDFEGQEIPCPENWGGYLLTIHYAEFWQGRENRLHDRIAYSKQSDESWSKVRLAP